VDGKDGGGVGTGSSPVALVVGAGDNELGFLMGQSLVSRGYLVYGTVEAEKIRDEKGARTRINFNGDSEEPVKKAVERSDQRGGIKMIELHDRDEETMANVVEILENAGGIHLLVLTVGERMIGIFEEIDEHVIERYVFDYIFSIIRLVRAVLPPMRRRRCGKIAFCLHWAWWLALPGFSIHSAAISALYGFGRSLRIETASLGIQIFSVTFSSKGGTRLPDKQATQFQEYDGIRPIVVALSQSGQSPNDVVARVVDIIQRPNNSFHNYVAPHWITAFLLFLRRMLPESLFEWIFLMIFSYAYNIPGLVENDKRIPQ